MTVSEQTMLANASGAKGALQTRLTDVLAIFQDTIQAIGNNVGPPNTICDRFRNQVMAMAIWEWLKDFPKLTTFKTDERKAAYQEAVSTLDKIANRLAGAISDPAGYKFTGNWNSQNVIRGRMWPTPPPQAQWSNAGNQWPDEGNPNATSVEPLLTVPDAPKNLWINTNTAGQLQLNWVQPTNAFVYGIWRGLMPGGEEFLTTVDNQSQYVDTSVTIGQTYWYYVTATNSIGISPASNEASAKVPLVNI